MFNILIPEHLGTSNKTSPFCILTIFKMAGVLGRLPQRAIQVSNKAVILGGATTGRVAQVRGGFADVFTVLLDKQLIILF